MTWSRLNNVFCLTATTLMVAYLLGCSANNSSPEHLMVQAKEYLAVGDYAVADSLLSHLWVDLETNGLTETTEAGDCLITRGICAYRIGRYEQSRTFFDKAVRLLTNLTSNNDPLLLKAINGRAAIDFEQSNHNEAASGFLTLISTYEKLGPKYAEDLAHTYHNLAEVYVEMDEFGKARTCLERALAGKEAVLQRDDPEMANTQTLLAKIDIYEGNLTEARARLETSAAIAALKPTHYQWRYTRYVLSELHYSRGEYGKAVDSCTQAFNRAQELDRNHDDIPMYRVMLGDCFLQLGRTVLAEQEYDEALNALGSDPDDRLWIRGRALQRKGNLQRAKGDFPTAAALFAKAQEIYQQVFDRRHRLFGEILADRGELLMTSGNDRDAEVLLLHALSIADSSGAIGMVEILPHRLLGRIAVRDGRLEEAQQHFEAARIAAIAAYAKNHTETARCLVDLADIATRRGDSDKALDLALQASEILIEQRQDILTGLTGPDAYDVVSGGNRGLGIACSIALAKGTGRGVENVWNHLLRSRGLVFEELLERRLIDAETRRLGREDDFEAYEAVVAELARLSVRSAPPSNKHRSSHPEAISVRKALIDELEAGRKAAVRGFSDSSGRLRRALDHRDVEISRVWDEMGNDQVLVAYYRIDLEGPDGPGPVYLAFTAHARELHPTVVSLGRAANIDSLVIAWRRDMETVRTSASNLLSDEDAKPRRLRETGLALRQTIWDPVAHELEGAALALLVPDGSLSLINFSALPADVIGRYLIDDDLLLHYLSSERDVIDPTIGSRNDGLLAVGAPSYGRTPSNAEGGLSFSSLDGTREEINTIASKYASGPVKILLDLDATEQRVRVEIAGRRVIHLATHGFFLRPDEPGASLDGDHSATDGIDPLFRSGLALAGANERFSASSGENDGLLLAGEIEILDLDGCEWAVLSACETGLGVLKHGEGVLGVRRAFQQAGVRTVISSLWRVDDDTTRQLFESLYAERMEHHRSSAAALRSASRSILELHRTNNRHTSPDDWGAFIAVGGWR